MNTTGEFDDENGFSSYDGWIDNPNVVFFPSLAFMVISCCACFGAMAVWWYKVFFETWCGAGGLLGRRDNYGMNSSCEPCGCWKEKWCWLCCRWWPVLVMLYVSAVIFIAYTAQYREHEEYDYYGSMNIRNVEYQFEKTAQRDSDGNLEQYERYYKALYTVDWPHDNPVCTGEVNDCSFQVCEHSQSACTDSEKSQARAKASECAKSVGETVRAHGNRDTCEASLSIPEPDTLWALRTAALTVLGVTLCIALMCWLIPSHCCIPKTSTKERTTIPWANEGDNNKPPASQSEHQATVAEA